MKDENILILCGFLDLFSVSIIITSLPLHIKSFNVSTTYLGIFFSLYGALQIISSYFMGYLADKTGKKAVICTCALLTSIGYVGLGLAPSFAWIFLLRFISGLFKQTQTISRTILATKEIPDNNDRVVLLGRFSTLSTVGFIFGPPIGGYVYQHYGFFSTSCLGSIGFLIMFFLFLNLDHESFSPTTPHFTTHTPKASHPVRDSKNSNIHHRKLSDTEPESVELSVSNSAENKSSSIFMKTWDIQLAIFFMSFCPLLFRTNYSLVLRELYESTSILSGFASSYGAITGSMAGLVVPAIIRFYNKMYRSDSSSKISKPQPDQVAEATLLFHTSLVLAISFLGCSLAPTLTLFILFQSPVSFANGLSREAFNMIITKRVSPKEVGRVMGMNGSLVAFGRLIVPVIGGLMQEISYRLPIFISSMCSFFTTGIIYSFFYGN